MGLGGKPKSKQIDTAISREQRDILKSRERAYQKFYQPALIKDLAATEQGGGNIPRLVDMARGNVETAYRGAKDNLSRSLEQRGVTGGMATSALMGLEAAKANAITGSMSQAYSQNDTKRSQLMQLGLQGSPSPTTALGRKNKTS